MNVPAKNSHRPLADRMRPRTLAEFVGQTHVLDTGKPLYRAIAEGRPHSMLFWGPPGSGKTTLARLVAAHCELHFLSLSAVLAGVKDVRAAVAEAQQVRQLEDRGTLLFVDEVHRFNKAQQDAFLPFVEDGTVLFIGATTENPSFEVNNALLSRARVYKLNTLSADGIVDIVKHALADHEHGLAAQFDIPPKLIEQLAQAADGDARKALNYLEQLATLTENGAAVSEAVLTQVLTGNLRRFDKGGDDFYDQISALHKSVRGSNPDAALYWLCRMLDGGCDPLYIARRVLRMASEDIGNADPRGLQLALDAWETFERLGSPEGELAIAQAVTYLACAPKSNAAYTAFKAAMADVRQTGSQEVPLHLRNAPTKLMKAHDYGKGYRYAHDEPGQYAAGATYFPEALGERQYYQPIAQGLEIKIKDKLTHLRQLDQHARQA